MRKHYFGPEARIVAVDIDPRCEALAEDSVLVIEKGAVAPPESRKTGAPSFDDGHGPADS